MIAVVIAIVIVIIIVMHAMSEMHVHAEVMPVSGVFTWVLDKILAKLHRIITITRFDVTFHQARHNDHIGAMA